MQKDKLIDFAVFKDGVRKLGTADLTLPDIEYMTDTMKGAGIAGEVDMLTLGQTSSMTTTINWRTITSNLTELAAPKAHDLEFRGAQQEYEPGTGKLVVVPVKVNIRGLPKKASTGKFEKASATDSSNELEVVYYKLTVNGQVITEIDKFNYIFKVEGTDYLAEVRMALGLA